MVSETVHYIWKSIFVHMSLADTKSMTELWEHKINLENTGLCNGVCFYGFKDIIICISFNDQI